MSDDRPLRSYGRVKGRALKPRQAGLINALLPHLAVPAEGAIEINALFGASSPVAGEGGEGGEGAGYSEGDACTPSSISPQGGGVSLLPAASPVGAEPSSIILEIGFGGGEHLVAQAAAQPDAGFIGVEPFLNGVGSCLRHIEESGVQNVRLHHGDARDVIARLPDASLDRVYILFPDPWPKVRHWKRRLIQSEFLTELARVLKPGGEVRFATDWAHYAAWTLEHFSRSVDFTWLAERPDDWRKPWPGHVTTRYEEKKLGDCAPIWLRFKRGEAL